jgi:hypothetical protein
MEVDMKRNDNYYYSYECSYYNMFQIVSTNLVETLPNGIKVEF